MIGFMISWWGTLLLDQANTLQAIWMLPPRPSIVMAKNCENCSSALLQVTRLSIPALNVLSPFYSYNSHDFYTETYPALLNPILFRNSGNHTTLQRRGNIACILLLPSCDRPGFAGQRWWYRLMESTTIWRDMDREMIRKSFLTKGRLVGEASKYHI